MPKNISDHRVTQRGTVHPPVFSDEIATYSDDAPYIVCPTCHEEWGGEHCHPVQVTVTTGDMRVTVRNGSATKSTRHKAPINEYGGTTRGVIIDTVFACENGHVFILRGQFHKGSTFYRCIEIPGEIVDPEENISEKNIWRD